MDRLLTLEEAGVMLGGVSVGYIRKLRDKGFLPTMKIGKGFKVRLKSIETFLETFDGQDINKLLEA